MIMSETINNATGLLEECLCNGDKSQMDLYNWFAAERRLIEDTIEELRSLEGGVEDEI